MKHDVFISYRRDGGEYTAKILRDRLDELGYAVFFDVESLRSGDFNTKLYSVIEECKDFILVLSPGALDRCRNEDDWVRREVEYALERGKNIVPVMLRGFEFPEVLPSSIEQLRFKNGIPANTEFFEAFIQKLQSFLRAKPPFWRRITQNTVFKRTLPVFLALVLLAAVGLGAYAFWNRAADTYPKSADEKNMVKEALYYVQIDMAKLDLMAAAAGSALDECQRYLTGGSVTSTDLEDQFEVSRNTLERTDLSSSAPSDRMLEQMSGSPLDSVEFIALHDIVEDFRTEWTGHLAHISWVVGPSSVFSVSEKQRIVDCYRTQLNETMRTIAYATNQVLLPITSEEAMDDFLYRYLPTLTSIPLSATSWSRDEKALVSAQDECHNKLQAAINEMTVITGNLSVEVAVMREALIQQFMEVGASRSDAELIVEKYIPRIQSLMPKEGDGEEMLWFKLQAFVSLELYSGAGCCVDALEVLVGESDAYAAAYIPALRTFLDNIDATGVDYGLIVMGYSEEHGINEVYEIGDVITEFNGQPCRNYEEYIAQKEVLDGTEYTVGVLRPDGDGGMTQLTLELSTDMPPVLLANLNSGTDT